MSRTPSGEERAPLPRRTTRSRTGAGEPGEENYGFTFLSSYFRYGYEEGYFIGGFYKTFRGLNRIVL